MKTKKLFALWLAAALLLAAGCGAGAGDAANGATAAPSSPAASAPNYGGALNDYGAPQETEEGWTLDELGAWEMQGSSSESYSYAAVFQDPNAKLIRRADLYIQTEAFDQSVEALNKLVAECGGYFETSSVYGGSIRDAYANRQGDYTVRVPAEKYSQFFNSAGELGYVTSSTESSEDVGEQYYDTEARLKTQRTKQERLLALLEKAESMEDIIALESALSDVEYQIEQYTSTLNRYDALIGFSTFTVCLTEVSRVTQEVGQSASLGAQMVAGVQSSFRGLAQGFQDLLIWVSYHLFLSIVLAAVLAAAVIVGRRELAKAGKKNGKTQEK